MMNKTEIFRKVGGILEELNEQYQYIADNQGDFNELELELFAANADFLADHIKILRKLSAVKQEIPAALPPHRKQDDDDQEEIRHEVIVTPPPPSVFVGKEATVEKPPVAEPPVRPEPQPVSQVNEVVLPPVSRHQDTPFRIEPEVKPVAEPVAAKESVTEPVIPEISVPFIPGQVSPGPVVSEPVQPVHKAALSLNDMISEQRAQQAASKPSQPKPVTDLKSIINLNDKLLFIKDLFNGYSLAYSEAIEILNRFDTFEAADHFLQSNYAAKNNWAAKQATTDKFYDILHRRFG